MHLQQNCTQVEIPMQKRKKDKSKHMKPQKTRHMIHTCDIMTQTVYGPVLSPSGRHGTVGVGSSSAALLGKYTLASLLLCLTLFFDFLSIVACQQ
jgi:L-serine deaminase